MSIHMSSLLKFWFFCHFRLSSKICGFNDLELVGIFNKLNKPSDQLVYTIKKYIFPSNPPPSRTSAPVVKVNLT